MQPLKIKLLETAITIVIFIIVKVVTNYSIGKTINKNLLNKSRGKIIRKIVNVLLTILMINFILIVWGVDQSEVALFMTSVLTILGVALFAQWSLLSNLTAGLILFFNHSVRLGDTITIMDKDYEMEGKIVDIGFFFITIKLKNDDQITLPCNVFLQKTIKRKSLNSHQ